MDNNYVFQYWEAIENGTVTVGKWIRTIYKILVDGLKSGKWDFDGDKANKAINFIENLLAKIYLTFLISQTVFPFLGTPGQNNKGTAF